MNKTELERIIRNGFSVLLDQGQSIQLNIPATDITWVRCALTEKGFALLIETDTPRSPFRVDEFNVKRIFKGSIRAEEIIMTVDDEYCRFIAVFCRKRVLYRLFDRLAADLIIHLYEGINIFSDPLEQVKFRLEGWRMLFSGVEKKAEEKGLIGELVFLNSLIDNIQVSPVVWTGPEGGIKDFRLSGINYEVKTTSEQYGYFVKISGIFQTLQAQDKEKLVFVRLEETPNGDIFLGNLIYLIQQKLNNVELLRFNSLINNFDEDLLNSPNKWNILEVVVFNIDNSFPKIANESFVNNRLPDGILQISWTSDLTGMEKIPIAQEIENLLRDQ